MFCSVFSEVSVLERETGFEPATICLGNQRSCGLGGTSHRYPLVATSSRASVSAHASGRLSTRRHLWRPKIPWTGRVVEGDVLAAARHAAPGVSPLHDETSQCVRLAEHRVVPGVELVPARTERLGTSALVRLPGVLRLAAPNHRGVPWLRPE